MKTSAGIYFKQKSEVRSQRSEELRVRRQKSGVRKKSAFCLLFSVFCLTACTAARYETVPVTPSVAPPEKKVEKEQEPQGFETFKGDRKRIVASWYGPDFHGRPTSSGELFNMYALTCAHKEYPFGTKLKVVNPQNNKDVECVVNDRGPFIPGRDLDLSYAAAKKIDLVVPGTGAVIIEPVGRDLRYVKHVRYGASAGTLTIQVGSFKDESNAKRLKTALELNYKHVYIIEANVGGAKYYRVRIGKFNNKGDAQKTGNALADEGYNVLITKFEQQI
jgi:rare lipoprotein A